MDNWYQIEQQSNTKAKRIRLEQVFYFRVGVGDHFADVSKTISMPKSAEKQVVDYKLIRYACYLFDE